MRMIPQFMFGTDLKEMQEEVDKVVKWFNMNRLLINNLKCCCMIIVSFPSQKTQIYTLMMLQFRRLNRQNTSVLSSLLNYIGVRIFYMSKKKFAQCCGLIRKLKHTVRLPIDCLTKYYMATVQSHLIIV